MEIGGEIEASQPKQARPLRHGIGHPRLRGPARLRTHVRGQSRGDCEDCQTPSHVPEDSRTLGAPVEVIGHVTTRLAMNPFEIVLIEPPHPSCWYPHDQGSRLFDRVNQYCADSKDALVR